MNDLESPSQEPDAHDYQSTEPAREVDSRELMQGHREIIIRHLGEAYRLSITRNNKLILRK